MLIKEYRISLPLSVEEYRIAQLYMIQKKSREESHGAGSGVEIIENHPYTEGPGGSGQYTYKIYHIGSHLPGWFRAILPKSALRVDEEAWNAYPYTKTRYRCPFIEKFYIEIETKYLNDGGERDNVFNMTSSEMKERTIDFIDIVTDPIQSSDYKKEEDPKLYVSKKTERGPLNDNWRNEYMRSCKDPNNKNKAIMTSYKLCRVEFKYWGMQNKIERFIHDIGLRKTMLRAHRQAWCWQDEYYGLQLSDIRRLERETQLALQETMAHANEDSEIGNFKEVKSTTNEDNTKDDEKDVDKENSSPHLPVSKSLDHVMSSERLKAERSASPSGSSRHSSRSRTKQSSLPSARSKTSLDSSQISDWRFQSLEQLQESSSDEDEFYDAQEIIEEKKELPRLEKALSEVESKSNSHSTRSHDGSYETCCVFDSIFDHSGSDSEFACENAMPRSSSMETLSVSNDEFSDARSQLSFETEIQSGRRFEKLCQRLSLETGTYERHPPVPPVCKVNTLILVIHGGNLLESAYDQFNTSKRSDYSTLKTTFDAAIKSHYPAARGHIALRLIPCPQISADALNILSSISPFGFDAMTPTTAEGNLPWSQEFVPLGAVALFSACNPEYQDHVNAVIAKSNLVYEEFLKSDEGKGFSGQVCLLADATGSVLTYDALCRTRGTLSRNGSHYGSNSSDLNEEDKHRSMAGSTHTLIEQDTVDVNETLTHADKVSHGESGEKNTETEKYKNSGGHDADTKSDTKLGGSRQNSVRVQVTQSVDSPDRRVSSGSHSDALKFSFEVGDFFTLGSPLGLVLSYRRLNATDLKTSSVARPDCGQIYNLFHASDPSAFRLEPLVNYAFKHIPPIKVARFTKYPMGDGESIQIVETMCHYVHLFSDQIQSGSPSNLLLSLQRQASVTSTCSQLSAFSTSGNNFSSVVNVSSKWWGNKRLDYMLYCPEVLHSFPVKALPPLFHASFWESTDVAAFVLRQILHQDLVFGDFTESDTVATPLSPGMTLDEGHMPKEKWLKRRTLYKVKNLQPNHRGNDVIVLEDKPQVLTAKFMYGPLDMTSLSGEKTDIHVMSSSGEWTLMGTEITDGHGRLTFQIPKEKQLSQGVHPVKMVVRVDHTTADLFLAVLPAKTETVVFSIDGSFTASVSIMGKDPKVKPGAVDVVRHWQELGYLILYVTARPDMQHNKVQAWLAQHNFPHGMLAFMDGFSKDPLKQKFSYLKGLQTDSELRFRAGYGSNKDIHGYRDLGLKKEQIFIVGKSNKKQQTLAMFISTGYAAHLEDLMQPGASRPASGNGIFLLRKSCFSLPSMDKRSSKRPVSSTPSNLEVTGFMRQESANPQTLISVNDQGDTMLQPVQPSFGSAVRARGTSPRPKMAYDLPR